MLYMYMELFLSQDIPLVCCVEAVCVKVSEFWLMFVDEWWLNFGIECSQREVCCWKLVKCNTLEIEGSWWSLSLSKNGFVINISRNIFEKVRAKRYVHVVWGVLFVFDEL